MVGLSGTGGGFQKFCNGETDISDASRPITQKEMDACAAKNIEYIELPVAYAALSVVVNPQNNWVTCITLAELKKIWEPAATGTVTSWSQVNSAWSAGGTFKLYAPGTDSGTFDYFTEHVNGKAKESRTDFTPSEDDNVLVQGVAGTPGATGYFGYTYYEENQDKLKLLAVDQGKGRGCVTPSVQTVQNGSYRADAVTRGTANYAGKQVRFFVGTRAPTKLVGRHVDFVLQRAPERGEDVFGKRSHEQRVALVLESQAPGPPPTEARANTGA